MKLYTEEQVEIAMAYVHAYHESDTRLKDEEILKKLTPIELPSDEEVEEIAMAVYGFKATSVKEVLEYKAFKRGARLIMNKIQGGNDEN